MSDTPRTRIEPEPSYPCCNCYEEYSWNAEDLRWFNGELWCANCFDELDAAGDRLLWSDLERFVPKLERENAGLRARNKIIVQMKEALVWVCGDCEVLRLQELERYIKSPCDDCPCKLALEAAERAGK
jgi:hypothetical protein